MSGRIPDRYVRLPVNFQTWQYLTFLHWAYDPATVQTLVPKELTVQQWDGVTWVGITPFRMTHVRGPGRAPIPGWRAFPELNIRTYVRTVEGRDGIWFLGLFVPRLSFVAAAQSIGLPYQRSGSNVVGDGARWTYQFGTPHPVRMLDNDWFSTAVAVGERLAETQRTPLLESITGRWTAFHRRAGIMWATPVFHEPWELYAASATGNLTAPLRWAGLPEPDSEPVVHAAYAVHARLGLPRRV